MRNTVQLVVLCLLVYTVSCTSLKRNQMPDNRLKLVIELTDSDSYEYWDYCYNTVCDGRGIYGGNVPITTILTHNYGDVKINIKDSTLYQKFNIDLQVPTGYENFKYQLIESAIVTMYNIKMNSFMQIDTGYSLVIDDSSFSITDVDLKRVMRSFSNIENDSLDFQGPINGLADYIQRKTKIDIWNKTDIRGYKRFKIQITNIKNVQSWIKSLQQIGLTLIPDTKEQKYIDVWTEY